MGAPVLASHVQTVPSSAPATTRAESGENATALATLSRRPVSVRSLGSISSDLAGRSANGPVSGPPFGETSCQVAVS